jgi:hypothetical protein
MRIRVEAWHAKKSPEESAYLKKRYNSNHKKNHREEVLRRNREYDRAKRERLGIPARNSKRIYNPRITVDPTLFLGWLEERRIPQSEEFLGEGAARAIRRVNDKTHARISLDVIDRVMTQYGAADEFAIFESMDWQPPLEEAA